MYIQFVTEYEDILDLFGTKFYANEPLQLFLKKKRREKKPLSNFLILPIQHIARYILLSTDLKNNTAKTHSEYNEVTNALIMITEIVEKINEGRRKIGKFRQQCLDKFQTSTN
eukprot:TRINITY_DN28727_c0_g1_i1.p1 TRINITY_DN28727_c0_g1~~TRINITY_DN28727_c0_g1_i1.p1  ORF type:complete len:113 (-),score=10.73 TRINITY_DN28727_c0_g1_i1:119-457(-)